MKKATVRVQCDRVRGRISPLIYGQFIEHMGRCVYGGVFEPGSPRSDERGFRKDVLAAAKDLRISILRHPGGCFSDEYHWRDGIGPKDQRPTMINTNWGNVTEDNSFGTHEFLELCDLLKTEPFIVGNVGSGTIEE